MCPGPSLDEGCIGFAPIPGEKGTGVCEMDGKVIEKCAEGRVCCKLDKDDCGMTKYCVPGISPQTIEKGKSAYDIKTPNYSRKSRNTH